MCQVYAFASNEGIFEEAAQRLPEGRPVPEHIGQNRSASSRLGGVELPPAAAQTPPLDVILCPLQLRSQRPVRTVQL